jgi:Tfp pilus assembly protein PilO
MQITTRKLVPVIAVLVIVLFSVTVLKPTLAKTTALRKENQKNKQRLSQLADKLEKLQAIDEVEVDRRVDLVEGVFPSQKPILDLLTALEELAIANDVEFNGIELKPGKIEETEKVGLQEFDIKFNVSGRFANIIAFVSQIEKTAPLMRIDRLSLKIEESSEEVTVIAVSFTVTIHYKPLPKTISGIEDPVPMLSAEEVDTLQELESFVVYPDIEPTAPTGKDNIFSLEGSEEEVEEIIDEELILPGE